MSGIVSNIASSIDFHKMIGQPFMAAAQAQLEMCNTTIKFLQNFCLDNSGNVITTTISCNYDDPSGTLTATDGTNIKQSRKALTVPLIALLNVPAFQMQKVVVDLKLRIDSMSKVDTSENIQGSLSGSATYGKDSSGNDKGGIFSAKNFGGTINASVSGGSSKAQSDSNSTSIIYDVHMEAENKPPPGLIMILDWVTSTQKAIAPDRTAKSGAGSGAAGSTIPSLV